MKIEHYFKQAVFLLQENRLLSFISVAGTAFAIAMIMVVVITLRASVSPLAPENNRDRMLLVKSMRCTSKANENWKSHGPLSYTAGKECFKKLTTAEAVSLTTFSADEMLASLPAGEKMSCDVKQVDADYWRIFRFAFLSGKPFTTADFEAGLPRVVITEKIARKLFGTTDGVGRTMLLNYAEYVVSGVVKNVSKLTSDAYAQAWVPFTSTDMVNNQWNENTMGTLRVYILARSADDFAAIRRESGLLCQRYNATLANYVVDYLEQPDTYFESAKRYSSNNLPDIKGAVITLIAAIAILLLVPAINLSGITLSRMRKRLPEIGVRKAFGATQGELMTQVLSENLLLTLLGGAAGLLLSYASLYLLSDMLFNSGSGGSYGVNGVNTVSTGLLFSPAVFFAAFGFCLLLNMLSAGIPAWRASRTTIVDALNQR
ncbi:MAG: ABC transporter permease [Bacteroides sp.]